MKKMVSGILLVVILVCMSSASASIDWRLEMILNGQSAYVRATDTLALRSEPSTKAEWLGSYDTGCSCVDICGRYWDETNEIWWVQCCFWNCCNYISGWTGAKRFDLSNRELSNLPLYGYVADGWDFADVCDSSCDYDDYDYNNYCDYSYTSSSVYGLATMKLSLRAEPTTKSKDLGTYPMADQYILLTGRHWDSVNSIWWLEVNFSYRDAYITGWTGLKRFDKSTFDLYDLPEY